MLLGTFGGWRGGAGEGIHLLNSPSHKEIKRTCSNPDSILIASPASFAALRESLLFFFCRSKRILMQFAPLTSYKWSELHWYMKILLCKTQNKI